MRYLVVHGHLYQPPRENPWTELVDRQPSAAPFHDWNERVSDECYEKLGGAAVRRPDGRIVAFVNLFGRISFNIGPTLAAWLERSRPQVLEDARDGFHAALERTGYTPALMQPYGHAILPLCDAREKELQIAWGRADYIYRFGREPEGIWFSETAVDLPSLDEAAKQGLTFTVLAPEQIRRVRAPGREWEDVSGARVAPQRPYFIRLPSGKRIAAFVFDGPLSRGAAFSGTLRSGESLLRAFRDAVNAIPDRDGIVLLAADGETFGHHQKGSEQSLAEALVRARLAGMAKVTHLGEALRGLPATWEAELVEPSAWSCAHGVGRWERACGCGMAHVPGWSWEWRVPLRRAVRVLRDRIFTAIDRRGGTLFKDPWLAAREYGDVLVRRAPQDRLDDLIARHASTTLDDAEQLRAAKLLEMIRQTLFASTSCGWFFDDIAGIEATQVLRHTVRAAELAAEVFGLEMRGDLAGVLEDARSNDRTRGTGADVFRSVSDLDARNGTCAIRVHALGRLESALAGESVGGAIATTFGAFAVSETVEPAIEKDGEITRVVGDAVAVHLRTGEQWTSRFVAEERGRGTRPSISTEGREDGELCAASLEIALRLASSRASKDLPALDDAIIDRYAWIGRQARELGLELPPPFPEALRGGARALVGRLLEQPLGNSVATLLALTRGLEACRAAGLGEADLDDLRPGIERLIASEARALATTPAIDWRDLLVQTITSVREVAGETTLRRLHRWLASQPPAPRREVLEALAEAAGMTPDALEPVDAPIRPPAEDRNDALI